MIPVTTIKIRSLIPDFVGPITDIMQQHGGNLEGYNEFCIASFPPGTTKEEISQLRVHNVRYEVTFPDGYKVWETIGRDKLHTLHFTVADFPDGLRKRFKNLIDRTTQYL